ncbi:MAG: hypothetical protein WCA06_20845 [Terrimicrobiaceae bacterium]
MSAVAVQEQPGHLLEARALREFVNVVSLGLQAGIGMDPADDPIRQWSRPPDPGSLMGRSFRNIAC